jgi:hypothetical protein
MNVLGNTAWMRGRLAGMQYIERATITEEIGYKTKEGGIDGKQGKNQQAGASWRQGCD